MRITVKTKTLNSMLRVIYSQYVKDSMSDYEKIAAAHKWLIQNVKYDKRLYTKGDVPWVSHTARGAVKVWNSSVRRIFKSVYDDNGAL